MCGAMNPVDDHFCSTCGTRRHDPSEEIHFGNNYEKLRRLLLRLGKEDVQTQQICEADGRELGKLLGVCPDASEFDFDHLRFRPESFEAMCRQLPPNALPKLPGFALSRYGSSIGERGCLALGHAASQGAFGGLQELLLINNSVGDAGVRALAKECTATTFPKLRKFVLSQNGIGPEGARYLAEAIKSKDFPQLYTLDLSDNCVGDQGARHLAKSTKHRDLHTLELDGNEIGNSGAWALARANLGHAHLHKLSLKRNPVGRLGRALTKLSVILEVEFFEKYPVKVSSL
jgi:hypothetical protein